MFGKVMSWGDELIIPGLEIVTAIPLSDIESIKESLSTGANPRDFKVHLAREIVKMYHGDKLAGLAQDSFENTFAKGGVPDDVIEVSVAKGMKMGDMLLVQKIVISKSEWRRLVSEGAVTNMDDGKKVSDPDVSVETGTYKVGKRRFIKIKVL